MLELIVGEERSPMVRRAGTRSVKKAKIISIKVIVVPLEERDEEKKEGGRGRSRSGREFLEGRRTSHLLLLAREGKDGVISWFLDGLPDPFDREDDADVDPAIWPDKDKKQHRDGVDEAADDNHQ